MYNLSHHSSLHIYVCSIRSSSSLTSLQLVQIPAAYRHIALILIHAARKALDVLRTGARLLLLLLLLLSSTSIPTLCVVESTIHWLRISVLRRLLILVLCCWCSFRSCGGAAAAEEPSDGVANGRADCDTTRQKQSSLVTYKPN